PAENCSCTILRCGSSVQNLREAPDFVTGYQRPSAPSTYGIRFSSCIANWTNSLARFLFLALAKMTPTLTAERYCIGLPSGLAGKAPVAISCSQFFFACARSSGLSFSLLASSSHLAAIEMVALCVIMICLLWKATLLSGSFQVTAVGRVQPLATVLE